MTNNISAAALGIPPMPHELLDFRVFLTLIWRHLNLPDPTPIQLDISRWLQYGPRRKVLEAFRGVGKSWITSAYVVWRLRKNPLLKFLVASASRDRSDNFSTFTLRLIHEVPVLQCLIPRNNQRSSKISFDVGPATADHAPSVKSVGIFGQLAGSRADEVIADDIEVPGNSFTQAMRDKLSEAVKEFDAILKPNGHITYLGTPQTEQSLYNLLPDRGYVMRIWPARFPTEAAISSVYGDRLAPIIHETIERHGNKIIGKPTDPDRFSELDLIEREASYGRSGFALQFQLDTRLSDADRYPLKLSDLVVMDLDKEKAPEKITWASGPDQIIKDVECVGLNGDRYHQPLWISKDWLDYTGAILAIDPSGRGQDETAYAVCKVLNGYIFVTDAGGIQGGYEDHVLQKLASIAQTEKVNKILIESNFGDGMFTKLLTPFLKRTYPCSTEEIRHNIQKEKRIIDTLEPVMNQHRLVVDKRLISKDITSTKHRSPDVAPRYQLFYQMSRITKNRGELKHDDRLDALAMAVGYWVDHMAQDVNDKIKQREEEMLDKELALFNGALEQSMFDLSCMLGAGAVNVNDTSDLRVFRTQ